MTTLNARPAYDMDDKGSGRGCRTCRNAMQNERKRRKKEAARNGNASQS